MSGALFIDEDGNGELTLWEETTVGGPRAVLVEYQVDPLVWQAVVEKWGTP